MASAPHPAADYQRLIDQIEDRSTPFGGDFDLSALVGGLAWPDAEDCWSTGSSDDHGAEDGPDPGMHFDTGPDTEEMTQLWRSGWRQTCDEQDSDPAEPRNKRQRTSFNPATPPRQTLANFAQERGLTRIACSRLIHMGLPLVMFNILFKLQQMQKVVCDLDCVEYYAGVGVIADAFAEYGYTSTKYDINIDATHMDACLPEGFLTSVYLFQRLREHGLGHWATVCSSWIFLCRDCSGRSFFNPEGHSDAEFVAKGNCQIARMCLIIALMIATSKHWVVEQPGTSLMMESTWMKFIKNLQQSYNVRTWMCMYGGPTQKSTQLQSGSRFALDLERTRDVRLDAELCATSGVRHETPDATTGRIRVTGHEGLKGSQEYPPGYGREVLFAWIKGANNDHLIDMQCPEVEDETMWDDWRLARSVRSPDWTAARLHEVADLLQIPEQQVLSYCM